MRPTETGLLGAAGQSPVGRPERRVLLRGQGQIVGVVGFALAESFSVEESLLM